MIRKSTGLIALTILLVIWQTYFWVSTGMEVPTRAQFIQFGAPYASEIYSGQFWGVITNSFLHVEVLHFLMNISLLFLFARRVERSYGTSFFILFILITSLVTSSIQLAMAGDAGLGLTSINLAFLFFMLGDVKSYWKWKWFKPTVLVLASIFVLFAIVNLYTNWILLGFSAIVSGILFGFSIGLLQQRKKLQYLFTGSLITVCLITLFYNPFSSEWNTIQGYEAFKTNKLSSARKYYDRAIQLSKKNVVAQKNLNLILIDSLSSVAYDFHNKKKYEKAKENYLEILKLDSNYNWAKENLKRLP